MNGRGDTISSSWQPDVPQRSALAEEDKGEWQWPGIRGSCNNWHDWQWSMCNIYACLYCTSKMYFNKITLCWFTIALIAVFSISTGSNRLLRDNSDIYLYGHQLSTSRLASPQCNVFSRWYFCEDSITNFIFHISHLTTLHIHYTFSCSDVSMCKVKLLLEK